jgi:hypothetical protein
MFCSTLPSASGTGATLVAAVLSIFFRLLVIEDPTKKNNYLCK